MTEARAGPKRVATLGDAWMRCRSISCAGWITCQSPTSLRSPPLEIDALGDHLQWLHHIFVNRWCAPARWGSLVGFRGDGERDQVTSASIKEPSNAFPRLRAL